MGSSERLQLQPIAKLAGGKIALPRSLGRPPSPWTEFTNWIVKARGKRTADRGSSRGQKSRAVGGHDLGVVNRVVVVEVVNSQLPRARRQKGMSPAANYGEMEGRCHGQVQFNFRELFKRVLQSLQSVH